MATTSFGIAVTNKTAWTQAIDGAAYSKVVIATYLNSAPVAVYIGPSAPAADSNDYFVVDGEEPLTIELSATDKIFVRSIRERDGFLRGYRVSV
ncbi:hypothetical protein AU106_gp127 [Sinorhizobium phage phiM9]|uniref:Uncharacterized protein n=1 Tax=Sinorhizobium phage phiM9 TaxID=1636182 RepID=A0A0F6R7K3_9CAUD|nr:hypothetical protein AU106_gp127 [Sinorhizobium phage phiM9]AKE44758.1 hypothetical protein Sm_phiM9_130 [Sinorhizobium phage phiM9]